MMSLMEGVYALGYEVNHQQKDLLHPDEWVMMSISIEIVLF